MTTKCSVGCGVKTGKNEYNHFLLHISISVLIVSAILLRIQSRALNIVFAFVKASDERSIFLLDLIVVVFIKSSY